MHNHAQMTIDHSPPAGDTRAANDIFALEAVESWKPIYGRPDIYRLRLEPSFEMNQPSPFVILNPQAPTICETDTVLHFENTLSRTEFGHTIDVSVISPDLITTKVSLRIGLPDTPIMAYSSLVGPPCLFSGRFLIHRMDGNRCIYTLITYE